jgi:hypothetical protein
MPPYNPYRAPLACTGPNQPTVDNRRCLNGARNRRTNVWPVELEHFGFGSKIEFRRYLVQIIELNRELRCRRPSRERGRAADSGRQESWLITLWLPGIFPSQVLCWPLSLYNNMLGPDDSAPPYGSLQISRRPFRFQFPAAGPPQRASSFACFLTSSSELRLRLCSVQDL